MGIEDGRERLEGMGKKDGGESCCKEWEERMAERTVGKNRKRVLWRERLEGTEREDGVESCWRQWEREWWRRGMQGRVEKEWIGKDDG